MIANAFILTSKMTATADPRMNCETVRNLFRGFTFRTCELTLCDGRANCFVIGDVAVPTCPDDAEFVICADARGAAVAAHDYAGLMRGYMTLLSHIDNINTVGQLGIAPLYKKSHFALKNRMIHFCIFPETEYSLFRRYIRLAAFLGFTHAVLEFWGTLRLDCCPEFGWADASWSREQVIDIIREMRELGIAPIPMINHLGHAPLSRGRTGKHVFLDQNPALYPHFMPDGWSWNTFNPATRKLLADARAELYDIFGEGEYFHAGLDESRMFSHVPQLFDALPEYLGHLTHAIAAEGRRPMIWMDMLLPPEAFGAEKKQYHSIHTPEECRRVLDALHPSTVLVDWEYDITNAPIVTSLYLKDCGFDVMGAPWLNAKNGTAHIDTATDLGLFGVMLTTWHTLTSDMMGILSFARNFGAIEPDWAAGSTYYTGSLLRKLTFEPLSYHQTGWANHQIVDGPEVTK